MNSALLTFFVILGLLVITAILNYLFSFLQWYMAVNAGINISLMKLFRLRRTGIPANQILENLVKAKHYGIEITWDQLQNHIQAGGNIYNVVDGMVRGKKVGLNIPFERATAADHKNINIPEAVNIIAKERKLTMNNIRNF